MKRILYSIFLMLFATAGGYGQISPCINGQAGVYPCDGYDLMSRIPLSQMGASAGNDSWGWTDPSTGKEYAIMCLNNGTAFIDISNAENPVYLGKLPTATVSSSWRDVKVYNDHAFIVSEARNHGMQVFDLKRLRSVSSPPQTFTADTRYTEFGNAHNIVINENTGFAYIVGAQKFTGPYRGGPLFVNIQNPTNPINAGGYLSTGQNAYTHDAQVITYTGPDPDHIGKEILIGSNEIEVVIADISDKANPVTISTIAYPDVQYTHQGWFTEDNKYFILGDELDEQNVGFDTRSIVFDFQDLDNPKEHMIYTGPTAAADHNGYVKGNLFFLANYRAGIRIIDIADIGNQNMSEIGFFDTYPSSNSSSFNGVWNVYPYFASGNIVVSDIEGGLFVIRKSGTLSCNATVPTGIATGTIGSNSAALNWSTVPSASYTVRYRVVGTSAWTSAMSSSGSYTISGLVPTTAYEAQVRSICADGTSSNFSASVRFTTTAVQLNYCSSNGDNASDEFIGKVAFGSIDNTSGAGSGGYSDFTSLSTNLGLGQTYTLSVSPTWTGTVYNEGYSAWIDWNKDGDFTDAGEQVWTQSPTNSASVSGSITIPATAAIGATRLRVSMKYNALPTACESFRFGEVEDYTVNIVDGNGGGTGCASGISSFPYSEGFEGSLGAWSQVSTDDIDWAIDANGTPSNNTGPASASEGSDYLYVEASVNGTGFPNKRALIVSPCFDLDGVTSATLSFAYHMFGATDMGSIALEASADNGTSWTSLWNKAGNQGDAWETVAIDLASYVGNSVQFRFNRQTGGTWQADVAIDAISLTTGTSSINRLSFLDDISFEIYPNPIDGNRLYLPTIGAKDFSYEIVDVLGRKVSRGVASKKKIDVSGLEDGVYLLKINYEGYLFSERFIKE